LRIVAMTKKIATVSDDEYNCSDMLLDKVDAGYVAGRWVDCASRKARWKRSTAVSHIKRWRNTHRSCAKPLVALGPGVILYLRRQTRLEPSSICAMSSKRSLFDRVSPSFRASIKRPIVTARWHRSKILEASIPRSNSTRYPPPSKRWRNCGRRPSNRSSICPARETSSCQYTMQNIRDGIPALIRSRDDRPETTAVTRRYCSATRVTQLIGWAKLGAKREAISLALQVKRITSNQRHFSEFRQRPIEERAGSDVAVFDLHHVK